MLNDSINRGAMTGEVIITTIKSQFLFFPTQVLSTIAFMLSVREMGLANKDT